MCDHHVIGAVKQKMLNRRKFVQTMAAVTAAVSVLPGCTEKPSKPAEPFESTSRKYYDLTHTLTEDFPTFQGGQNLFKEAKYNWEEHKFNLFVLRIDEHTGTHIDAPLHFSKDGMSVDELTVDNLIVPLVVIDIKARAAQDPDTQVTPDDITAWIGKNGDLPDNCCVVMNSGWAANVRSDKFRNTDEDGMMHFPGFHDETASMLIEQFNVAGVGVDTLSLDHGPSKDFGFHYGWLPKGRWGLECLANLDAIPEKGGTLIVGAPKHKGGSGGPCRVFAMF